MKASSFIKIISITTIITVCLLACNNKTEKMEQTTETEKETNVLYYKVSNLSDSLVADSIWKMIFTFESIDQLILQKEDSLVIIKGSISEKPIEDFRTEILTRGGVVVD